MNEFELSSGPSDAQTSIEFSGTLGQEEFEFAISQVAKFSEELGESWTKEGTTTMHSILPKTEPFLILPLTSAALLSENFKPNAENDIRQLVKSECEQELLKPNPDCILCIFGGVYSMDHILKAVKREQVEKAMITVAAKYSKKLHAQVVETYAKQIIAKGEKLKAVSYLLLINRHEQAIRILLENKLYREAFLLKKISSESQPKKTNTSSIL